MEYTIRTVNSNGVCLLALFAKFESCRQQQKVARWQQQQTHSTTHSYSTNKATQQRTRTSRRVSRLALLAISLGVSFLNQELIVVACCICMLLLVV